MSRITRITVILYFLKFDIITWVARLILVLLILSVSKNPPQWTALPFIIIVGLLAVFFSLFHVRSSRYVRNLITTSEAAFKSDFLHHFELSDTCEIHLTKSFAADKNTRLRRRLDGEIIYPQLIFMTYYETLNRLVIHIRVKSLLKENTEEDFFYEVPKGSFFDIKIEKIDAKIEQVMVKFPDINGKSVPEFPMRTDFHLRNVLKACSYKYES